MPKGRLLLVAADSELRRSLVFVLETEGYYVVVRDAPPSRDWLAANRFDCTILDQRALSGPDYESIAFCIKAHPVVLVATAAHPWLVEWVSEVVDMPLRADAVSSAVRRAMHDEAA